MKSVNLLQLPSFKKTYKRLHNNQKVAVDTAIKAISKNPSIGTQKKGDLAGIYVYKFNCVKQEFLLAYEFDPETLTLVALGIHENLYRDLKLH